MERLNIWGLEGCMGPDGKPCHACCIGLAIHGQWRGNKNGQEFHKDELIPCEAISLNNSDGHCSQYNNRPRSCEDYHCSKSQMNVRLFLLEIAAAYCSVDRNVVERAKDNIINGG